MKTLTRIKCFLELNERLWEAFSGQKYSYTVAIAVDTSIKNFLVYYVN